MGSLNEDPSRGMKATFMLADFAQAADGKLNMIGGGWTIRSSQPAPFAIAGIIEVPAEQANKKHRMRFELIDLDGQPINVETPEGEQPLVIDGEFEVARMLGAPAGTALTLPVALNHPPVPLPPGPAEWRWEIDGETHVDWRLAFVTLPDAQSHAA